MSNTVIQLKYSTVTDTPTSLNIGEPAYSFTTNKLFIGNSTNHVLTIGGKYYTDIVDAATDANTVSTLVKRDSAGIFSATAVIAALYGNANTASKWQTARDIGVSGDATGIVSVDGSANANIPLTLSNSGVSAGNYGGATQIPTFSVDAKGRITSAANVAISVPSSLNIAADTGTNTVALATDTLTVSGGDGVTTSISDVDTIKIDVDNTVLRTTGNQSINGDFAISGNLVVSGSTITQDVENIKTEDSLIQLASNNAADILDIGFIGSYTSTGTKYTGLIRDASDSGKYKLLTGGTEEPAGNTVNVAAFTRATLDANITGGTVSGLSSAIGVSDGGTGASTFTNGRILIGQGTSALTTLANVTAVSATVAAANTLNSFTTDTYGRVTAFTQQAIAIGAAQITSGTLPIARGGTNQTSFTNGQRIIFNGTSLASQANATTTVTGGLSAANTITSFTVNSYGEVTAYTGAAIAIAASQITSGTLSVARGGTGNTSFTTNGVLIGQDTSALTTASSSTEGHVLTINASGVPTFMHLSGGTF